MPVAKLSISLTPELAKVVRGLARERGEDTSRFIEILLRENGLVGAGVERARAASGGTRT